MNRQDAEVAKKAGCEEPGEELATLRSGIKRVVHTPNNLAISASWRFVPRK
jgi:hypothetical protein